MLNKGIHHFHFITEGQCVTSESIPVLRKNDGTMNNVIEIKRLEKNDIDTSDSSEQSRETISSCNENLLAYETPNPVVSVLNLDNINEDIFKVTLEIIDNENSQVEVY